MDWSGVATGLEGYEGAGYHALGLPSRSVLHSPEQAEPGRLFLSVFEIVSGPQAVLVRTAVCACSHLDKAIV